VSVELKQQGHVSLFCRASDRFPDPDEIDQITRPCIGSASMLTCTTLAHRTYDGLELIDIHILGQFAGEESIRTPKRKRYS
jgi:hypothetical protein